MTLQTERDEEPFLSALVPTCLLLSQLQEVDVRDLMVRIQSEDHATRMFAMKNLLNTIYESSKKH